MDFEPFFKSDTGKERSTDHLKDLYFNSVSVSKRVGSILNSSLFYLWFTIQGNCRNIAEPDINSFPIGDMTSNSLEGAELFLKCSNFLIFSLCQFTTLFYRDSVQ